MIQIASPTPKRLVWLTGLLTVAVLAVVSCGPAPLEGMAFDASPPLSAAESSRCPAPARVAVLVDKSRSAPEAVVVQPTFDDFEVLITELSRCGGVVAVGSIAEAVRDPLVTLDVPAGPQSEPCDPASLGPRPPMILATLAADCRTRDSEHRHAMAEHALSVETQTADFQRRIAPMLERPPTASRTELWLAVALANTFLEEQPAPTALIFISDGVHTTTTARVEPRADHVMIVNGLGHTGHLGDGPRLFSSVRAAFQAAGQINQSR